MPRFSAFPASLLVLALAAFGGGYVAQRYGDRVAKPAIEGLVAPTAAALPAQVDGVPLPSLAPMLEHVTPAVVSIQSRTKVRVRNPLAEDPFFRQFFGLPEAREQ